MVEAFKVGKEVSPTKDVSPIEVSKDFSGLKEKVCDDYFSKEVKISFNFSFKFPEDVSIMSLAKEDVVRSSTQVGSSL